MKQMIVALVLVTIGGMAMAEEAVIADADDELIAKIYAKCLDAKDKSTLTETEKTVYEVEGYNAEINSGVDFIQWFTWTKPAQAQSLPAILKRIGADESSNVCVEAIQVVFPKGIPSDNKAYSKRITQIQLEDTFEEVRDKLSALAEQQVKQNVKLATSLAAWIRKQSK